MARILVREARAVVSVGPVQSSVSGTVESVCIARLAAQFCDYYFELGRPESLNRDLDRIALACVALSARRHGDGTESEMAILTRCRDVIQTPGFFHHLDTLAFNMCLDFLGRGGKSIESFENILTHANSEVRRFLFGMGWMIRHRLNRETCAPGLIKNVENTLHYWEHSLTLCRSLFEFEDDFWLALGEYRPEEWPSQYHERVQWAIQNREALLKNSDLCEFEGSVWKLIAETALAVPISE